MFVTLTTVWFRKVALKMWSVRAGAGMPPVCLLSQQGKCRNGEWVLRNSHSTLTLLQHPGMWQVDGSPWRVGTSLAMTKLTWGVPCGVVCRLWWVSSVLRNTKLGLHRRGFGKCWFHASYFHLSLCLQHENESKCPDTPRFGEEEQDNAWESTRECHVE